MQILINLSTLKAGGGQNVGLNFVNSLIYGDFKLDNFHFVVAKNSEIEKLLISNKITSFTSFPKYAILRIIYEILFGSYLCKKNNIDIIYTLFGYGLYPKKIRQVIGMADSNLFFPEINFWSDFTGISLIKKQLIDKFRIFGLSRSSGIIFENPALEKRFKKIFDFSSETITIYPSINLKNLKSSIDISKKINFKDSRIGLFLCGWQKHKGIFKIPDIAFELKKQDVKYNFIITAPINNSKIHNDFMAKVQKLNVKEYISIIGPVKQTQLMTLYNQVDIVFLISKLESFSNNIIEAWAFKKLLIVSDSEWAHSICGNAAIYVNRESAIEISNKVIDVINKFDDFSHIIENGKINLANFNNIFQKTKKEIEFVKKIYKNV